jgi:translocation and assembly module TamB
VANLETSGTLEVADVAAGGARIRSGDLRYDASGLGGSRPSAAATVSLRGLDAGVEMRSVQAEVRLAPEDPPEVRIDVAAVTVEGRTQSLGASVQVGTEETTVLVDVLSLDVPGGQWRLAAPARIVQRPERIVVSGLRLANGEESIEIEGGLAEAGGEELRLSASRVSLSVANEFAPDEVEDIDGTVDVDLRIAGTLSQPEPSGSVALRGGKATIRPLGLAMSEVTVEVDADPRRIELTTLSARAGEGSLEASGTVLLEEGAPGNVDLRLGLDRWPAIRTQQVEATVAGSVTVSGPASGPAVAGRIDVVRAVLRPELSMLDGGGPSPRDPTIIVLQERVDGENGSEGATADGAVEVVDAMRDLSLDLRVAIERDTWVRHPMAGLELFGAIDLRKRPRDELLVTGQVRVVRGWIYFQGRRFTPTKGEVTFTGGDQVDPSLDIELQTRVAAYTIDAAVGGTAREPSLELRSEPRLEEADILALLMFGKPVNNLDQGEEVALQQQAQSMAANLAAGQVGQAVSDSLGLGIDIQEIDVVTGRVALGRYLTPQTYVSVAQELAGRGGQQVTVDYYVTPRWTLRTTADSTGNNGADVFWRLEY